MASDTWARPELLAETDWLAAHLQDPDLVLVDCDLPASYARLHIPGAVPAPSRYWKGAGNDTDVHAMSDPERVAAQMRALGINDDSLVVAYDGSGGLYAARLWWTLDRWGHQRCKVLHGGLDQWYAEGRPLTREHTTPAPASFRVRAPNVQRLCTLPDIAARRDDPGHVFWDVRSEGEWTGANARGTQRGGRIPGAVHWEWLENLNHPLRTLKAPQELRRLLSAAGMTPDKAVTTY